MIHASVPHLPPIRPNGVAIVLADLGSNCHSPALFGHLFNATDPAALASLCDGWSQALVDHGADLARATAFVAREAARVRESFPVPEQMRAA